MVTGGNFFRVLGVVTLSVIAMGSMAMYSVAKYKGGTIAIGTYSVVPSVELWDAKHLRIKK